MNIHNLSHAKHAANEYGGYVKIVKWFRLPHKSSVAGLNREGDSTINNNF